jgi:hypothetical protein
MKRRTSQLAFTSDKYCRIVQKLFFYSAHQFYLPGNVTEAPDMLLNVTALEQLLNCTAPEDVLDYQNNGRCRFSGF